MALYDLEIGGGETEPTVRQLTAEEVAAISAPGRAPDQVAMHKVEKAALLMPWPGFDNLAAAIEHGISQLPSSPVPKDKLAMIEWKRAENLVREGATTLAVMAILGMTEAQRDELLTFAASLP